MARRNDRPEIRAEYRKANPDCELSGLLWMLGIVRESRTSDTLEIHHVIGGSGRRDAVGNLVTVNRPVHRWLEANVADGRIACLAVKAVKGEVDPDEYRELTGQYLSGWLACHPPQDKRLDAIWRTLCKTYPCEA